MGNFYTLDQRAWRAKIISLYGAKCFVTDCPIKGDEPLEAHHLYCQSSFPEKALDTNNGVLIKRSIHHEFHKLYGRINCQPQHFEEFLREHYPKFKHYSTLDFPWRKEKYNLDCDKVDKRFRKSPEFYEIRLLSMAKTRGHILLRYMNEQNKYENKHTRILIGCTKHGKNSNSILGFTETKTVMNYLRQDLGMNCCAKESAINKKKEKPKKEISNSDLNKIETPPVDKELESKFYTAFTKPAEKKPSHKTLEKHVYVLNNIEKNNHIFNGCPDSPIIINYKYTIVVSCPHHQKTYETTSTNYLRSPKGLPCCSGELGNEKIRKSVNKLFTELAEFINSEI